jgi:zinc and cadmium transporter
MLLTYIVVALIIGSVGSVALAALLLLLNDNRLDMVGANLVSLAGGTLLGAAFLGMLPKAVTIAAPTKVFGLTLSGIVVFFIIEKAVLWRTCHERDCPRHQNASAQLIIIGDAFHNAIDGIVIASAFFASVEFGILVTLSVFAHEIPQEIADFGVLINNGMKKSKALLYNMLSGAVAIPAGIIAYVTLEKTQQLIPYFLAFSASSFIYIALADLVPQMHKKTHPKDSAFQLTLIIAGILIIYLIKLCKP